MEVNGVVETFLEESSDLFQQLADILPSLNESGEDEPESISSLFRLAHTIKGSAGICYFNQAMGFTHQVEKVSGAEGWLVKPAKADEFCWRLLDGYSQGHRP